MTKPRNGRAGSTAMKPARQIKEVYVTDLYACVSLLDACPVRVQLLRMMLANDELTAELARGQRASCDVQERCCGNRV